MHTISPLRYPGGKTIIRNIILELINENQPVKTFVELYAGGAGLGLWLLENEKIDHLYLNDKDEFIYKFWHSVLFETNQLIERIEKTPVDIKEWATQRMIISHDEIRQNKSSLDIGFAALFLNRCNRSGIIRNDVGPIGGKNQNSKWKIDVRFNKEKIIEKINKIAKRKNQVTLSNYDALEYTLPSDIREEEKANVLVYLDPPYYKNGDSLYRSFYKESDHINLRNYLVSRNSTKWVLSYDNSDFIRDLYTDFGIHIIKINHHAHKVKNGTELIILPSLVKWPNSYEKNQP